MAFVSSPPSDGGGSVLSELSDARLVAVLVAERFEGATWRAAEAVCAAVAVSVLHDLLLGGAIAQKSFSLDRPITPTPTEVAALRLNEEDRADLVHIAVVDGIRVFQRLTLEGRGWRADGGASLLSYVVNGCVRALANPFRSWRTRCGQIPMLEPWPDADRGGGPPSSEPDPLAQLVTEEDWQTLIDSMPLQLAQAVQVWRLTGESWTQIATRLGVSRRSLEGLLRRWRKGRLPNERDEP